MKPTHLLIAEYEAAGDAVALAKLARDLIAAKPPSRVKKPVTVDGLDPRVLLSYELEAAGVKALKDKIGGGTYEWVLVRFADGVDILTGAYPRVGDDGRFAAQQSARRRYVRMHTAGDRSLLNRKIVIPAITAVEHLTDPAQIDAERLRCFEIRKPIETRVRMEEMTRMGAVARRIQDAASPYRVLSMKARAAKRPELARKIDERFTRWHRAQYEAAERAQYDEARAA